MKTASEHLAHHAYMCGRHTVARMDDEIHAEGARKAAEVLESKYGGSHPGISGAVDAPVSEAQRRAMGAAMGGHSNIGIPQSVGKEFIEKDPGGKLPEKAHDAGVVSGEVTTSPTGLSGVRGMPAD